MSDFDKFINDLTKDDIEVLQNEDTKKPGEYSRQTFPCDACNGTGIWRGGFTRAASGKCYACNGLGHFVTSKAERLKAKASRDKRKANKREAAREANEAHEGLLEALGAMTDWNDFARSLFEQHLAGKAWSDKQVAAAKRMVAKVEANRAAKAEAKANAPEVDLSPIAAIFDNAIANGHKKPMYRADGLRIKPGKNGALYVMTEARTEYGAYGEQPGYEGKIVEGKFHRVRATADDTLPKLQTIAENPFEAAVRYGRRTGTCACCGRELTNAVSIQLGIGPICREKWGL